MNIYRETLEKMFVYLLSYSFFCLLKFKIVRLDDVDYQIIQARIHRHFACRDWLNFMRP